MIFRTKLKLPGQTFRQDESEIVEFLVADFRYCRNIMDHLEIL